MHQGLLNQQNIPLLRLDAYLSVMLISTVTTRILTLSTMSEPDCLSWEKLLTYSCCWFVWLPPVPHQHTTILRGGGQFVLQFSLSLAVYPTLLLLYCLLIYSIYFSFLDLQYCMLSVFRTIHANCWSLSYLTTGDEERLICWTASNTSDRLCVHWRKRHMQLITGNSWGAVLMIYK